MAPGGRLQPGTGPTRAQGRFAAVLARWRRSDHPGHRR